MYCDGKDRLMFSNVESVCQVLSEAYPGIFSGCGGFTPGIFFRGVPRGQRERESGGSSPLIRGFTQFANEQNPYSD
jgi:hypothetical protein